MRIYIHFLANQIDEAYFFLPNLGYDRESLMLKGAILFKKGMHRLAVEAYEEAIRLGEEDLLSYKKCLAVYGYLRNIEKFRFYFKKAVQLNPYDAYLYLELATVLILNNKNAHKEEIEDLLARALTEDPFTHQVYDLRSIFRNSLGDYEGALSDCLHYLKLVPHCKKRYAELASIYHVLNKHEEAIRACSKHLAYPENARDSLTHKIKISSLIKLKRLDEAVTAINHFEELFNPASLEPNWVSFRARLSILKGDTKLALQDYTWLKERNLDLEEDELCLRLAHQILRPNRAHYLEPLNAMLQTEDRILLSNSTFNLGQKLSRVWDKYINRRADPETNRKLERDLCRSPEKFTSVQLDQLLAGQVLTESPDPLNFSELTARLFLELGHLNHSLHHPHPEGRKVAIFSLFVISTLAKKILRHEVDTLTQEWHQKTIKRYASRKKQKETYLSDKMARFLRGTSLITPLIPPAGSYDSPESVSLVNCLAYVKSIREGSPVLKKLITIQLLDPFTPITNQKGVLAVLSTLDIKVVAKKMLSQESCRPDSA